MTYEIRYFFDLGSGVCLWAKNEDAREKFGYPIEHWELPLSENTNRWIQYLISWFDTSFDWSSPADSDNYWSEEELQRFNQAAKKGLELLRQELPSPQYEFIDETSMSKSVQQQIGCIALVVENYDDAIEFYTKKLQFTLVEDTDLGGGKRWVQVSPPNSNGTNLLLAQTSTPEQSRAVGNQTGGRVFLFLQTNDFWRDYELMKVNGVVFNEEPRVEEYGTVVVFEDLYGNKWDLLQLNSGTK